MRALSRLSAPRPEVLTEGRMKWVPARELVPGGQVNMAFAGTTITGGAPAVS